MAILNNSNAISSGGYDINNSLRLRKSASAYLNRTPASAGNRKTWTWSGWVKRGELLTTEDYDFFAAGASDGATFRFSGGASHTIRIYDFGGSFFMNLITTQVFRDPSAWYHIVLAVDSTQATSSNRVKLYVNGTQVTAFSTAVYPSLNQDCAYFNNNVIHNIGRNPWGPGQYYDGYLTEVNFIDGQALTPSSFGETDTTTGSWKPKAYSGTYGTNGFYLKFSDIATTSGSNAGLGKDFSGNANYWTTNNISVTAGTTYDAMIDSPTLTSATVANYPVLNPLIKQGSGSVTEGNLKGAGSSYECWGTMAFPSTGKYYFEYTHNGSTGAGNGPAIGIVGLNKPDEDYGVKYNKNGTKWLNGTNSIAYGASYTTGDVIGVAYDADNNSITFYKNNTSQGATTTASGYTYLPYHFDNSGSGGFLNFGQRPFSYTPPTGYVRMNTYNLPDSTIKKGNTVMDATLWTGNGTSQSIVNAGAFKPDFVWVKSRSNTFNNNLFNSTSGINKFLVSDTTAAEASVSGTLTAFNSNGFSVGSDIGLNYSGGTYVGWQWQAGQGSTSSNTSGSITSTVSANTTAGFSIVTYTGNGTAGATVGHGLGVAPVFVIWKNRSVAGTAWLVQGNNIGNPTDGWHLTLHTSNQRFQSTDNNNTFGSTTITLDYADSQNGNGNSMVAYCWAAISGYSAFGSYLANGSTDGPMVYTGFQPKFLLLKGSTSSGGTGWYILDATRNTYNVLGNYLSPNNTNAENSLTIVDFLSNGFKLRTTNSEFNASGQTWIYMAFAENPFKNANAR